MEEHGRQLLTSRDIRLNRNIRSNINSHINGRLNITVDKDPAGGIADMLREKKFRSENAMKMHREAFRYYTNCNRIFNIIINIITTVVGIAGVVIQLSVDDSENIVAASASISLVVIGGLNGIMSSAGCDKNGAIHKSLSDSYKYIVSISSTALAIDAENDADPNKPDYDFTHILDEIDKKNEEIDKIDIDIPQRIVDKYKVNYVHNRPNATKESQNNNVFRPVPSVLRTPSNFISANNESKQRIRSAT